VHISRLGVNSIEFEVDTVEMPLSPGEERSFELVLINYGAPTHVNISASESLSENITILEDNPYVRHEEYIPLIVRIPYDGRIYNKGTVFITVGYGSHKESFKVNVGFPGPNDASFSVDVDKSLSSPKVDNSYSYIKSSKKDNWSTQLPDISLQALISVFETAASRSGHIVVGVLVVLGLLILTLYISTLDFSALFSFYHAVFISILLTSFMAYLLIKLPIFK
jgi:hypothetical protein